MGIPMTKSTSKTGTNRAKIRAQQQFQLGILFGLCMWLLLDNIDNIGHLIHRFIVAIH
jgi:hypothetical protein